MMVLKWLCFILICIDVVGYIIEKSREMEGIGTLIGLLIGIAARVFVLYGTLTCWLLA
jgi:hypothetical protein